MKQGIRRFLSVLLTACMVVSCMAGFTFTAAALDPVTFYNNDGADTVTTYTLLESSDGDVTLDGVQDTATHQYFYVVKGNVTIDGRLLVNNTSAHIILCDDARLTVTGKNCPEGEPVVNADGKYLYINSSSHDPEHMGSLEIKTVTGCPGIRAKHYWQYGGNVTCDELLCVQSEELGGNFNFYDGTLRTKTLKAEGIISLEWRDPNSYLDIQKFDVFDENDDPTFTAFSLYSDFVIDGTYPEQYICQAMTDADRKALIKPDSGLELKPACHVTIKDTGNNVLDTYHVTVGGTIGYIAAPEGFVCKELYTSADCTEDRIFDTEAEITERDLTLFALFVPALTAENVTLDGTELNDENIPEYTYTGKKQVPAVVVTVPGEEPSVPVTLTEGTDYTITYYNSADETECAAPTDAGEYFAVLEGIGGYGSEVPFLFTIAPRSADDLTYADIPDQAYDGTDKKPVPTITYNDMTLAAGTDFDAVYDTDCKSIGTHNIALTFKGSYTGEKTLTYKINAPATDDITIEPIADKYWSGLPIEPEITAKYGDTTLAAGTDYTLSYSNNTNAGTATITVTFSGIYSGTRDVTFKIVPLALTDLTIGDIADQTFTGEEIKPAVTVKSGEIEIAAAEYDVTYADNVNAGTATVTVSQKENGNITFTALEKTFTITPKTLTGLTVAAIADQTYTGEEIKPAVTVINGDENLAATEYTVTYANNINVGTATVTVSPAENGNFTFTAIEKTFTITPKTLTGLTVANIADQTYTGAEIKPAVTVKSGEIEIAAAEYDVTYANNINVGTATVTVSPAENGNITFTAIEKTFTINPKSLTGLTVAAIADQTYTGAEIKPTVTVMNGDKNLAATEYTVTYANNINVGTATVTVSPVENGNITFTAIEKTFTITPKSLTGLTVAAIADQTYTGEEIKPTVTVINGDENLAATEYTVTYANNINVGTATVTVSPAENGNITFTAIEKTFTITPKTLTGLTVAAIADQTYTGAEIKPTVTVMNGDKNLAATEYTVTYANNINVGTATVTVSPAENGNITFTAIEKTFTITPKSLTGLTVAAIADQTYTGAEIKPTVTVINGDENLATTNYTVTYANNVNVGTATVTVSPIENGNITFTAIEKTFTINPKSLTGLTVAAIADQTYTGAEIKPTVTVMNGDKNLAATEYTVTYANNINVGTATVTVSPVENGNITFTALEKTFTITPKALTGLTVAAIADQTYTGEEIKPDVTVKNGEEALAATDYTVTYANNINVGTATVTVSPVENGNITFTAIEKTFTINPKSLTGLTVAAIADQTYTGAEIKPAVTVMNGDKNLAATEYTVTYADNINVGTATVTVSPAENGNITFTALTTTFTIKSAAPAGVTVAAIADQTYTGVEIKPDVTVKNGEEALAATDYTVTYANNVNAGTATVTVSPAENSTVTFKPITKYFRIVPKELTIASVTAKSRKCDGTNVVEITAVTLTGVCAPNNTADDVAADVTGLTGVISSPEAGTYTTLKLPEGTKLNLIGAKAANYTLAAPTGEIQTSVTISKIEKPANTPAETMEATVTMHKVSDVPLPTGWVWADADKDTELKAGESVTATAAYTAADASWYELTSVNVTITKVNKSVTAITLKSRPTKYKYPLDAMLDVTGGVITAFFDNGTSEDYDITPAMVSSFDSTSLGEKTLTVTFEGKTASFEVKIYPAPDTKPVNMDGVGYDTITEAYDDAGETADILVRESLTVSKDPMFKSNKKLILTTAPGAVITLGKNTLTIKSGSLTLNAAVETSNAKAKYIQISEPKDTVLTVKRFTSSLPLYVKGNKNADVVFDTGDVINSAGVSADRVVIEEGTTVRVNNGTFNSTTLSGEGRLDICGGSKVNIGELVEADITLNRYKEVKEFTSTINNTKTVTKREVKLFLPTMTIDGGKYHDQFGKLTLTVKDPDGELADITGLQLFTVKNNKKLPIADMDERISIVNTSSSGAPLGAYADGKYVYASYPTAVGLVLDGTASSYPSVTLALNAVNAYLKANKKANLDLGITLDSNIYSYKSLELKNKNGSAVIDGNGNSLTFIGTASLIFSGSAEINDIIINGVNKDFLPVAVNVKVNGGDAALNNVDLNGKAASINVTAKNSMLTLGDVGGVYRDTANDAERKLECWNNGAVAVSAKNMTVKGAIVVAESKSFTAAQTMTLEDGASITLNKKSSFKAKNVVLSGDAEMKLVKGFKPLDGNMIISESDGNKDANLAKYKITLTSDESLNGETFAKYGKKNQYFDKWFVVEIPDCGSELILDKQWIFKAQ